MRFQKSLLLLIILLAFFLRIYKVADTPPSPYWEEVALGYDAYSVLKTGADHHGNILPVVAFESFGDWKPSLYFYTLIPSIAFLGLNILAVRLPSILAGTVAVWAIYYLVQNLLGFKKNDYQYVALFSALFLAITPWSLQLSRVGFEANLGLTLVLLGAVFFIKFKKNDTKYLNIILAALFFGLSFYSYHGERVFVPLLLLVWGIGILSSIFKSKFSLRKLEKVLKKYALGLIILVALGMPIALQMTSSKVTHRFAETSAFTSLAPIISSNQAIADSGNTLWARLVHHRYWYYAQIFARNYLSHFNYKFLFDSGDVNVRHSSQFTGELYPLFLPFLILGIAYLFSNKLLRKKIGFYLSSWLLIAPVAAALTLGVPHALRSYPLLIPLIILSAIGLIFTIKDIALFLKNRFKVVGLQSWLYLGFVSLLFINFWLFYKNYLTIYSQKYSQSWQYGYQQVVQYIKDHQSEYDQVFLSRAQGRPAMYYWFYSKENPYNVQNSENISKHDQGEFLQYQNIYFDRNLLHKGKTMMIDNRITAGIKPIITINFLDNTPAFYIWEEHL